jgi:threonine/homoserine/homoserine lactone efflux protein
VIPTGHLLGFVVTSLALIVVPGPSVLFIVSRALTLGERAALATVVGNEAGEYLQVLAVAFGIGVLVERSLVVFTILKLAGAAYIIVLGIRAIRNRRSLAGMLEVGVAPRSTRRVFREGFVVGASNPKTVVFFAAILPQFVDRHAGPVPVQMLIFGLVFLLLALLSDSVWALVAARARARLARSPARLARIGGVGGLVMIGLGARLAISGRKA